MGLLARLAPMASGLADLMGFLRSLLFTIPLVFAETIVMGLLSLLVAPLDRDGRRQHACARLWARLILWTSFIRLRVRGLENVDPTRAYVYIANHQSYMDIPVLFTSLPVPFRIMAKATLFPIPFLGWHLRRTGNLPIPFDNPYRAARRLLEAVEIIRQGHSLVVFPEGGRSRDAKIGEFKTGVFLAAIRTGAPLVPITIRGSRFVLPPQSWHIRPGTIDVVVEAPIETSGFEKHQAEELSARVRTRICENFASLPR